MLLWSRGLVHTDLALLSAPIAAGGLKLLLRVHGAPLNPLVTTGSWKAKLSPVSRSPCAVPLPRGGFTSRHRAGFPQWSPVQPVPSSQPCWPGEPSEGCGAAPAPGLPAAWDVTAGHSPAKAGPAARLFRIRARPLLSPSGTCESSRSLSQ